MRSFILFALSPTFLIACGDNVPVQQISGRVDGSTFTSKVDTVRLLDGQGNVYTEVPLAADGRFFLQAPSGESYRIVFVGSGVVRSQLVFPRATGVIDRTFRIHRPVGGIDIGAVRYVGDPTATPYVFTCTGETDPNGMCVDDSGDGQQGANEMSGDNNQCGDNEMEHEDGEDGDGDGEEPDDKSSALAHKAAVPQTNLEGDVGCTEGDGDGEENDDEEEGDGDGETDDDHDVRVRSTPSTPVIGA